MWFRDKLGVVFTTIIITIQITTLHCVPIVSRTDALQRNLETRGNKIPFGNANNAKKYKDPSPETSMYKTYNFPEIEFPHESSLKDPLYSGRNLNTNPFNARGVSSLKCKACNDLKKDMRMKRKLDRMHENHKTNIPNFSSGLDTIKLTDTDMFPEVKYPLNAIDAWEPHYWNPSIFSQKEEQYVPPDFPIFNPKMSDKGEKASRPYKKQSKSKTKQFMEDIDLFNEKMRSSRSQSQKTIEAKNEKDLTDTYNKNSESSKQPESNDIKVLRMDVEAMSNKTKEVNREAITYECLSNASTTDNRELPNLSLSQVNSTISKSPLSLTSKMECNNLDGTPMPISYKVFENNNFSSDFKSNNAKDEHINSFTDEKNEYISNEPPYLKTHDVLDEDVRIIILNTTSSSQQPDKIANIIEHMVSSPVQDKDTIATIPNDDPLNVKIPLPAVHAHDKIRTSGSMKDTTQLSRSNTNEHTLANIIVIPIDNSANKKPIRIVDSSTGSPIIVFLPTTKTTITSDDTLHSLPLITKTVSNDAFGNLSKTSDVHEPLQINITDLPGNILEMKGIPTVNVLDIPCTTVSDTKLLLPDFEILPNNSMCHVLPNEANSKNMITELYNATESSNGILSVIDIPFSVENLLQNYTHPGLTKNNGPLPYINTDDNKDNTSFPEVIPASHARTDMDKTAKFLAVSKLIDLILKDLVKKDPFMLVDKILPEKSIRGMDTNVEELPASKDIVSSIQDTIMTNDIKDSTNWSEKSTKAKNNMTIVLNVVQQNQPANITKHIPAPTQNENSPLSEDIRDNIFSPFSMKLSDKVDTQLTSSNIESFNSLASSKELTDIPLTDGIEDNKSLPLYTKLPDSLLTDLSLPSNNNESFESLPVYETLMDPQPSVTTGDIEFPLSLTDRFVNTALISNDNESFDSLPGYEGLQESPLRDQKGDDMSLPMSINIPESLVTDKPFDDAPLLSSDDKSLHSLPDYKELISSTLSDNIGDDTPLPISRKLSDSILTNEALDISSISNDYKSLESLPIYEALIGSPFSDTMGVDMPLPLSKNLSDGVVNTILTSSDIESFELLPGYVTSSMELPDNLLTNEAFNDTALTFNHNGSVESIPVNEVFIDTSVNDTFENDISLPIATKLSDRSSDTPLTISNIESLESLPDYEDLTGNPFSDSIEDDSSLSSSLEGPFNLLTNNAFLDTSSSNSDSLEALSMYETLTGSSIGNDVSLPWSIELPDSFDDTPLSFDDIESLKSLTDDEEPVEASLSGDMEDDISLPMELSDSLLVDNAFKDTLLISNDNKSIESLQRNQALSANPPNDSTWDDILSVQLLDNNDETIQESHSVDILPEGAFMESEILFTENDKRLLARNTIPDSQESNNKEDEVLLIDKITNDLNDQIPVDKKDTNKKSNNMPESEAVKVLINKQLSEITTDDRPLYVDKTLTDSLLGDSPLEINRISQTDPTPNTKVISGDLTSSINKKVPVFMDKQLSSAEVLYTSIVKYLYDAV